MTYRIEMRFHCSDDGPPSEVLLLGDIPEVAALEMFSVLYSQYSGHVPRGQLVLFREDDVIRDCGWNEVDSYYINSGGTNGH